MPLRRSRQPAEIVVALTGGVLSVEGQRHVFRRGQKLRTDHPVVRAYPSAFAPDGMTDADYAAKQAMLAARDAA